MIYRDGRVYLAVLDETRAFLFRVDTGIASGTAHPQSFAAQCNGAMWLPVADSDAPIALQAEIARRAAQPLPPV